jgi:phage terminase large subunit GpA-like protein
MHTATASSLIATRWLPAELAAWRPAERLPPSAWAEKHRVLTRTQSARHGKWRNAHAPHLAGLMDLCVRRDIEEITIVKAAQVGVSEALRNVIGYYAYQEPDPILLVLPDEQSGRKIVARRLGRPRTLPPRPLQVGQPDGPSRRRL